MTETKMPFKHPWVYRDAMTVAGTDYVHIAIKQKRGVNNYANIPVAYE